MSKQELLDTWRERFDDFAQSEMTVQNWCDFNRVSIYQYYYWRRRMTSLDAEQQPIISSASRPPFLPVALIEATPQVATAPGGVTVRVAGAAIELQPDFDPSLLRAVVRALAPSC